MKFKYLLYIFILLLILFRPTFINFINNLSTMFISKNDNLEIIALKNSVIYYENEYLKLIDFKSNIKTNYNYTITNVFYNNYGFNTLTINGSDYKIGNEVITENGLIGIINKIHAGYSEVSLLKNTTIPVNINEEQGKISGINKDNNLIIKDISNYNKIYLNDPVYSIYGTLIGKIIEKENYEISASIIVKPVKNDNLTYVAVISR